MNETEKKEGLYRQNVSAVIIDRDGNFLLEQKVIYNDNEWGFIGGGIESGEDLLPALFREIQEELGLTQEDFEVIGFSTHENRYLYDPVFLAKVKADGSPYIGQVKTIYVLKFKGNRDQIKPDKSIRHLAWVTYDQLPTYLIFPGQLEHAQKVIKELIPEMLER